MYIWNNIFRNWKVFEIVLLLISLTTVLAIGIYINDTTISIIGGLSGIIAISLSTKGNRHTYIYGSIYSMIYIWTSYNQQLYGETMLHLLFIIPMSIWGFFSWSKTSNNGLLITKEKKEYLKIFMIVMIAIIGLSMLLKFLNSTIIWIDSLTTIGTILAFYLMKCRLSSQWIIWIIIDLMSISTWSIKFTQTDSTSAIIMITILSIYTIYSFYGLYNWSNKRKIKERKVIKYETRIDEYKQIF